MGTKAGYFFVNLKLKDHFQTDLIYLEIRITKFRNQDKNNINPLSIPGDSVFIMTIANMLEDFSEELRWKTDSMEDYFIIL